MVYIKDYHMITVLISNRNFIKRGKGTTKYIRSIQEKHLNRKRKKDQENPES
jgi:hypothetical protein